MSNNKDIYSLDKVKAIRLEIFQPIAQYRVFHKIPYYFETYLLPPPSTVIGLVHNCCGFKKYENMYIGIKGTFQNKFTEFSRIKDFSPNKQTDRWYPYFSHYDIGKNGEREDVYFSMSPDLIKNQEFLSHVNLIIHIVPEDQSEEFIKILFEGLERPRIVPSLGRHEDLCKFKSVEIVELKNMEKEIEKDPDNDQLLEEGINQKQLTLIPTRFTVSYKEKDVKVWSRINPSNKSKSLTRYANQGLRISLNKKYVVNKKGIREFEKVDTVLISNFYATAGFLENKEKGERVFPL